jgi:RNA polymerase sigma-70 factor, ECF subfamily
MADDVLLARIAAGDVDALAELFRRQQQAIYRFALHLSGSPALADDVTQDVFVAVIRDAGKFEPGRAAVPAWLCGIARNFVRRRLALDRGARSIDDDEGFEAALPIVTPDPIADLTTTERIEALRRAVLALPMRYREAVVLCDLQEMSYVDAAATLECPVGTVRSRLNRGRALLAAKMQAGQREQSRGAGRMRITKALA